MKLQDFRGLIAITIGLIVLSALALNYTLARLRDSFGWVEHTNGVIRALNVSSRAILTAESGERGYLLTGDQIYLESYKAARGDALSLMDTVDERVADNPEQKDRARALRRDLLARLDEFDRAVALEQPTLDQVREVLSAARATRFTERIQSRLDEMRDVEFRLLTDRQAEVNRSTILVTSLTAVISVLAVLSAAFSAFVSARQQSLAALRTANDALASSEQTLKVREAHLTAILATVPDAMVTIDENGTIGSFSATAERLFNYRQDEVLGKNVNILMPSPYRDEHDSYIKRYLRTGVPHIIGKGGRVVIGARKDGTTFPMELSVGQIDMAGRREFVGFVRDMTERHERERQVHEIQSELFRVSRLSTMGEMAGALAHELNQPLAAVSNYISAARRGLERLEETSTKAARDMMSKAGEQVMRAGGVIQRLRDFIARGQTERQVTSLRQMVEESVGLALLAVKDRAVQLALQFDPTVDQVLVDKIQVQQVLLNMIRNAIEAMDAAPERALRITTRPVDNDMVRVEIADSGAGISPQMTARLFEPFATSKSGGLGIGLSISRTIIESHGGDITVAPNPGGGTIFRFTLPLAPTDAATATEPAHAG